MNPSRFFLRSWLTIGFALLLVTDVLAQTRAAQTPARSTATPNRSNATQARPTSAGGGGGGGGGGASSRQYQNSTMLGDAMITSDMESRRLIIVTDDETNENIKTVIASLDKPKPQVLINVVFLQVTHADDLDLGAEASYTGRLAIKNNPRGDALTKFGIAGALADPTAYGAFYKISGGNVDATIHALATKNKTEILSRPSILTRSSQQATILVGQTVPIITNSRVSDTTNTTINTVTYQDVGIILRVTPFITQAGLVEMIVSPEISSLSATTVAISNTVNSPVIDKRSADTVVVTPSDQTVVIGGLISTQVIDQENKVPILGDIPILGYAFKRNIKKNAKTELLIFLTPHVVMDPTDLSAMAKDERAKLELAPKTFEKEDMNKYLGKP